AFYSYSRMDCAYGRLRLEILCPTVVQRLWPVVYPKLGRLSCFFSPKRQSWAVYFSLPSFAPLLCTAILHFAHTNPSQKLLAPAWSGCEAETVQKSLVLVLPNEPKILVFTNTPPFFIPQPPISTLHLLENSSLVKSSIGMLLCPTTIVARVFCFIIL